MDIWNRFLNIVQKINQKVHILAGVSKYTPQKKLRSLHIAICILYTNLDNS